MSVDEEARAKHQAAIEDIEQDPEAQSTLASIKEWRDAEVKAITKRTRGVLSVAITAIVLSIVAICVTVSFGILSLLNTNSAHHENAVTRGKVESVLTLATASICTSAPQTAGCPPPKPGQTPAQSQQQQIVNNLLASAVTASKENCVAAAQQLSITTGIPATVLDDPCDAIK